MAMAGEQWQEQGRAALAQLDHIIERHPDKISEAMAEAVGRVVGLRDLLIDARRQGDTSPDGKARLDRTNGILSLLVGVEYPVKSIHWKSVCEARDAMKEMMRQA